MEPNQKDLSMFTNGYFTLTTFNSFDFTFVIIDEVFLHSILLPLSRLGCCRIDTRRKDSPSPNIICQYDKTTYSAAN